MSNFNIMLPGYGSEEKNSGCGEESILEACNLGFLRFLLDEEGLILQANAPFYFSTGYSEEEFRERFPTLKQLYGAYPHDFVLLKERLTHTVEKGGDRVELTARLPRKNGDFTWMRFACSISHDGGTVCRAVLTNITESMAECLEHQRMSENRLRCFTWMMEEYAGNVYISDMESYELLYVNKHSCETLGQHPEQVLGRKCYEVIQGRTSPCPFCTNKFLTEDKFYEWEFDNPVLKQTFMIKNRKINWNGHKARIELSHDAVSPEYKLAKKDRERDAIIRTIPGGFARVDARDMSTILWYGGGFLEMIGYSGEQFEKELYSQCTYVHPDDLERTVDVMENALKTGEDTVAEARIITRSGAVKYLTMTFSYVSGKDSWDGIPSFYSVGLDVTRQREEQERQRQALEEAYQSARVASAAKTNFLSSMSHDIRTPMNAIMGMTAIAEANIDSPEKVRDCLHKISTSNRHLLSLVNEVLDMSKIESGKIDLSLSRVELSELIQNVMDMCRPLIEEKHQQFHISIGKVLHERVIADCDRLQQILMNLLSNAIKYTPQGGRVSLRINELYSPTTGQSQYEFVCADNGIGISEEFISHIFEPFSRAEDSRISTIQGTGLGLAITENIVRMMNGTINVQSELERGTTFTVAIPLEWSGEEAVCSKELTGLSVLVVDDDQITCENAAAVLNELGMRGEWVLSGREAVRCIAEAHTKADDYFAVILDWKMPEMDGLETVKVIRRTLGDDVPIIIVSAYDYSEIEQDFLEAGADAFINKPLFKSRMYHVLQMFISKGHLETAASEEEKKNAATLSGKRVLLVEDQYINREIAIELLRMKDIRVDAVENGQRAVEVFTASAPGDYDAILMDIQMPVMNGYDAAAAIRALDREDARVIPILALTANAFASDVGKARSAGMNDHIAKPIDSAYLFEVLDKWMCQR